MHPRLTDFLALFRLLWFLARSGHGLMCFYCTRGDDSKEMVHKYSRTYRLKSCGSEECREEGP